MSRAVLSLGSNLDDPVVQLRRAARGLAGWTIARSSMYRTKPVGPVEQADFLNAVMIVDDSGATPHTWLERAQTLESKAGRQRHIRYGPRTLDVDIVSVDDVCSDDPLLTLPHPRAAERAFVLVPWLQIALDATLPGRGAVSALVAALPASDLDGVVVRPELDWGV